MAIFTDTYIKSLKPQSKRVEKFEGGGFGILVYPAGTKSWIYRYKINGQKDYIILGHYPLMSLSEARRRFGQLRDYKRSGDNPKKLIQIEKIQAENTMDKISMFWYEGYVTKNRKKPHQIKQQIDADIIPLLGNMAIDKIEPIDISNALDKIVKRGASIQANRVLSTIKQIFNYAVSRGYLNDNPASNIRSRNIGGIEKPKERFLTLDEIKIVWEFLDTNLCHMSIQTRSIIKIMILTGVRTAEIRLARWKEFDFEKSLWTIPPENTKGGITVKVHITELMKAILLKLKRISDSEYVMPGLQPDKPLDLNALPRAIRRIQKRVGIPEWTAHDLRRTFATQLGETLQIDPVVIEKCLGHKMPRIMATYNKNEMLPQRKEALELWSNHLDKLIFKPK